MSHQRLFLAAAIAVSACVVSTGAQAQCGPDGFTVPGACCAPTLPTLPSFPPIQYGGQGNCITNCGPTNPFPVNITISAPAPVFCDTYILIVNITGTVTINGLLVGKYLRTWDEVGTTGTPRQVWRFLINGDLTYTLTPPVGTPCPVPKIAAGGMAVHFDGHIDYARDCGTTLFSSSVSMAHLCGDFEHASWSPNPIPANPNPDTVYAIVGPLPFVWGAGAPPAGPLLGDAVRSVNYNLVASPAIWQCESEVATLGGAIANIAQYCPCANAALPPGPTPWTEQQLNFQYGCNAALGSAYTSLAFPPLVPTGLSAIPIGGWAMPAGTFPNSRRLHPYFGIAHSPDICVAGALPFHITYGVMTSFGPPGTVTPPPPGATFTSIHFLDLENTLVLVPGAPFVAIGFGGLSLASRVWSLNL